MKTEITTFLAVKTFVQEHAREVRGERILSDVDVAKLYEVSVANIYKTVVREKDRFPTDFMFLLSEEEKKNLSLTGKKVYAFTQMGILMLGGQLKSPRAIKTYMQLIELFVGMLPGKTFDLLTKIQDSRNEF